MKKAPLLLLASLAFAAMAGCSVLIVLFAAEAAGANAVARPLYPDLKTQKPKDLRFDTEALRGRTHHVLRFSNTVYNAGEGPLEVLGKTVATPAGREKTQVYQRVYDSTGNRRLTGGVGKFAYHPTHDHFHFGDFAEYQLWKRAEYDRWVRSNRKEGFPRRADRLSSKVTFCIMDTRKMLRKPGMPLFEVYERCGRHLQGLSIGWGDTYEYSLPEQWVDLGRTPLANGRYVLRSVADPDNRLYESEKKSDVAREGRKANAAVTYFRVKGSNITVPD